MNPYRNIYFEALKTMLAFMVAIAAIGIAIGLVIAIVVGMCYAADHWGRLGMTLDVVIILLVIYGAFLLEQI